LQEILNNGGAELFRVNPDDTWDLIAGQSRSTPAGNKPALSGLGAGFGWVLNQHMWRMEVFNGTLYVGTYDVGTELRKFPIGSSIDSAFGFDFWASSNGIDFYPIDYRGFGDKFNYGVRSLKATPYGLFIGTANPFYGLQIYVGTPVAQ
jgi:hypothetical protein